MIAEALKYLSDRFVAASAPQVIEAASWGDRRGTLIRDAEGGYGQPPVDAPLVLQGMSLASVVQACRLATGTVTVSVEGPFSVKVISDRDDWGGQDTILRAAPATGHESLAWLGRYHDREALQILLETALHPDPETGDDRDYLVDLISSIQEGEQAAIQDNGLAQVVTVQKTLATLSREAVRRTVSVAPVVGFADLPPIYRPMKLRLKKEGQKVTAALFPADGNTWQERMAGEVTRHLSTLLAGDAATDAKVVLVG